jgi:hypothetical protein
MRGRRLRHEQMPLNQAACDKNRTQQNALGSHATTFRDSQSLAADGTPNLF